MIYKIKAYEVREYTVEYTVEADDAEDAIDKAALGDTLWEDNERLQCVTNREFGEFLKIDEVV